MKNIIDNFTNFNNAQTMWLWFIPASVLVFIFSYKMVKYAEVIIAKTKFGGAFVGGALISVSTSLTELVTEITQGIGGTPEVGLADDIGANYFSTFCIAIVSLIFLKQMFMKKLDKWTKISIMISLVLTIIFTIVVGIGKDYMIGRASKFAIGLIPFIFFIGYLIYIFLSYKMNENDNEETGKLIVNSVKKGIIGFVLYSLVLLFAAFFLNIIVDSMKKIYKLNSKSAGGIFLSMTTAMPEVVSLVILAFNKQPKAAIASIIGSHIFNLSLIVYGDMSYVDGAIVSAQSVKDAQLWKMGISTIVLITLLLIFVIISKKIKNKYVYAIMPSIMIFWYIMGWVWMLLT